MLFNIESDTGDRVNGYLVPDTFSGVPKIRISSQGREVLVMEANEIKQALVVAGRHETGNCGFIIDESMVPGLAALPGLELSDLESGLTIYRRAAPHSIPQKILRLETHLLPLWRIDDAVQASFQYFAKGIEKFGRETVTQLFLLSDINSIYLSGRVLYKNYAYFIEGGFQTIILVQDPYHELAERLLVLAKANQVGLGLLGERDSVGFKHAAEFAASLPSGDEKGLQRMLRQMPEDVAAALANPLVRQLTTSTPDEMPAGGAVAAALDLLSAFAIVGLRKEANVFRQAFAEMLPVPAESIPPVPQFPSVANFAESLQASGEVDTILEKDRELYYYLSEAFSAAATAEAGA